MQFRALAMTRRSARLRDLAILCALGFFGLACPVRGDARAGETSLRCTDRPVRMAVASSLHDLSRSVIHQLREHNPPVEVEPIFGASSAHARQLSLGAPIDVFVSADAMIVDDLVAQRLLLRNSALEFATGQLSLVARSNWRKTGIDGDEDARILGTLGVDAFESDDLTRIAIPSAAVPLGRYARAWLASRGLLDRMHGKIVETEHARATLAAVDAGHVDLAVVYRSDLRLAKNTTPLAHIDPSEHPSIRYVAARTARAPGCPSIDLAIAAWGTRAVQLELTRGGFIPAFTPSDL